MRMGAGVVLATAASHDARLPRSRGPEPAHNAARAGDRARGCRVGALLEPADWAPWGASRGLARRASRPRPATGRPAAWPACKRLVVAALQMAVGARRPAPGIVDRLGRGGQ